MIEESKEQAGVLKEEDYSRAMNFLGQNLLSTLSQAVEQLPPELRNRQVITQALSAFLANVIHKQFPGDEDSCQQLLGDFANLTKTQLTMMVEFSKQQVNG